MICVVDASFASKVPEEAVVLVRALVIATLMFAVDLLVGCATTVNRTAASADRLQSAADAFAGLTCYEPNAACTSNSHLQVARGFSDEAHEFRKTLEGGASDRDVLLAYERLWRRYHTLRYEVSRLGDRALQTDWGRLTVAFADVQQHVKAWYSDADPALASRGGYLLDPYYN
jgi:hypothetical protein